MLREEVEMARVNLDRLLLQDIGGGKFKVLYVPVKGGDDHGQGAPVSEEQIIEQALRDQLCPKYGYTVQISPPEEAG